MRRELIAVALALWVALAGAAEAPPAAADPVVEARMVRITSELRCLVCQNETVAGSTAPLADDLRREVRTMIGQGKSDQEIRNFMTERYGDFVLYRPPVKGSTVLLWYGPAALLLLAAAALVITLRRRNRLPPERFEPDVDD